jgi:putative photosynthetic complex assembly protein 2
MVLAVGFALFVWWFSTGLVIFLDNLPRPTFRYSMLAGTFVAVMALDALAWSSWRTDASSSYCAFASGVLVWGWLEMSFYLGYVTGPRKIRCAHGCHGWTHFGHAIMVSLYHELAIFALAGVVIWATWGAPNQVGLWTFVVLWWMHQSARLNVFLGVRNIDEEFLPAHLDHLRSFFRRRSMNPLFPVSIVVSTLVFVWLIHRSAIASPDQATGPVFLATMMGLAILEHWFLMVPLPSARLWRWSLRSRTLGPAAG